MPVSLIFQWVAEAHSSGGKKKIWVATVNYVNVILKGPCTPIVCTPIVVRREWMSPCLQFFAATTVDNLFGNLNLLENISKIFLIDIMRHNNIDTDVNEIKQPC